MPEYGLSKTVHVLMCRCMTAFISRTAGRLGLERGKSRISRSRLLSVGFYS